jgi:hypothetical protein
MTREEFEAKFDSRTRLYASDYRPDARPVVIGFGPDIHSPAGHLLLTSLCNLIARAHQRIVLVGDLDASLLCRDVFRLGSLEAATAGLITAIHPFRDATLETEKPVDDAVLTIGLGGAPGEYDLRAGTDGWVATFGAAANRIDANALWGAAFAACLTAGCAFHALLGRPAGLEGSFSLWEYGARGTARGPAVGAIDVGRVLQAGAGAVGSALNYWLSLIGLAGDWLIVDGDVVSIDNLNRQIFFLATDTEYAGTPVNKAEAVVDRMGSVTTADPHWYGEVEATVEAEYDLVLPLANEHGARALLQARPEPLLLHATTSRSWQAQLHRHMVRVDDCIVCRIPEPVAGMQCSTGEVAPRGPDAALPFLSATAGLLLAAALVRVGQPGYGADDLNFRSLVMHGPVPLTQGFHRDCELGCPYGVLAV